MPILTDIPVETLLDNLLPYVPAPDLCRLACTNRFFATLCNDDTFWKRKLQEDFNFSGEGTARTSGWKFIYKGLSNPRVFVWGETSNGRLGLTKSPRYSFGGGVPAPAELRIPGVRIVSLTAGGMSFHALDSEGRIHVWGALNGEFMSLRSDGFSVPEKSASKPLRLQLPTAIRSISCGRLHSAALDANSDVWNFRSWGRPFRLVSPLLDKSIPESTPAQIECGWAFTSVLTQSGDVIIWWPFLDDMHRIFGERDEEMNQAGDKRAEETPEGSIACVPWDMQLDPFRLPPIPRNLPELLQTGDSDEAPKKETKLVKIAAGDNMIIGLTNKGHVLHFGGLGGPAQLSQGRWEYLPRFSEVQYVREHPTFSPPAFSLGAAWPAPLEPPETMQITHISAHFQTFTAYSTGASSVVLMGSTRTTPDDAPDMIPALQNKGVISVVLGDYHYGALTSTGKLYTWGAFSKGALGLGNPVDIEVGQPGGFATQQQRDRARHHSFGTPPRVEVPTEVRFDHGLKKRRERFCFAAAAAGWHTGALVIDLEPGDEEEEEVAEPAAGEGPRPAQTQPVPAQVPFLGRGMLPFRVGFPGRGRRIGPGRGQGPPGESS
ncbi:RCC1/BLIP-II protein [Gloeophyllum trabeum ATCC 11539]|uniref:RCC1/BLIP-II protein n=1 Tax=Gloeophyllum trabeum (strain ATCC 11539 / FP-39264 / Madison 617) TaxID=670483 RepID=S7Q9D8_GLOTA|nr:RCC1/BLIP-II protein [Gloeophyllum trabeum ATCC 11539]EPQ56536.1 RCC1/BLIP-II protein [Gloeophyllum trabeum ATCC 11539]